MREYIIRMVEQEKVIAIIRSLPLDQCVPVAQALLAGGIRMMEVTFNQKHPETYKDTAAAIEAIRMNLRGEVLVGAGTVTSQALVHLAADAGAEYIISPDVHIEVVRTTLERGLVSMPGAATPTEIMTAHAAGADFVKLFPAGTLGSAYLKAICAPISHIKLLAVGGINAENAGEFLAAGACGLGVGGNLAKKEWMDNGEFEKITAAAQSVVSAVRGASK